MADAAPYRLSAARRRFHDARSRLLHRLRRRTAVISQPIESVSGRALTVAGRPVTSFVCASYLGLEQDPRVLTAVCRAIYRHGISLGSPRLLAVDPVTRRLERSIAGFTGHGAALIYPSTTHCALDLLPLLSGAGGAIYVDRWAYPTQLAGVREAQRRGAVVRRFDHNSPASLAEQMRSVPRQSQQIVVCDGVYASGGQFAPLRRFARIAASRRALLYVDDSHGLGLLGEPPVTSRTPYGLGGGGLLRRTGPLPVEVVVVGTLAKALGVPLAFAAGPAGLIQRLKSASRTLVHSSPPSIALAAAALEALRVLDENGDARRSWLGRLVDRFQRGASRGGLRVHSNGLFPIQTLPFDGAEHAVHTAGRLRRQGIWSVLQLRPLDQPAAGAVLRFYLTALHTPEQIDRAIAGLLAHGCEAPR